MIAAVELPEKLCVVKRVGREGLRAVARTYCGGEHNAGNGTVQVPDAVFRDGIEWKAVDSGKLLKPCVLCKKAIGL